VTHAHLGYNIVAIQKQLMCIALLIKEILGNGTFFMYSSHSIKKEMLRSASTDVEHMSEEFLGNVDVQILMNWSIQTSSTCMILKGTRPPNSQ
jgi:hypothetical protein